MKTRTNINKKRIGTALISMALLTGSLTFSLNAFGATSVKAQLSPDFTIVVDGSERTFYSADGSEAHPIVYNGTTYLPLRAIGELMGKNVNWDQSSLTVTISGTRSSSPVKGTPDRNAKSQNITAEIRDDFTIVVDGVTQKLTDANGNTVYPMLYNGSTYLPLRSIGQLMGKSVSWDSNTETVTLSSTNGSLVTDADSFNKTQNNNSWNNASNGTITVEDAKNKALAHAGLSASQVNFVKANKDWDDGREIYEVEFYTKDYKEYDYEIDARTGEILSYDYDAENYSYTAPNTNNSGSYIGENKAKSIALGQVSGANESNVAFVKFDYDDGRAEYEVKIIYNAMEHEFEIDALTGRIISRDTESVYD